MQVEVDNIVYEAPYFPYYKKRQGRDFQVFAIRFLNDDILEIIVYEEDNFMQELYEHAKFLIKEYMLEEDIVLTSHALNIKENVSNLFKKVDKHEKR